MKLASTFDRFPIASIETGGVLRPVRLVRCACGFEGRLNDQSRSGLPVEAVARSFTRRGWEIGARKGKDRCPRCSGGKVELSPAQKRAAFCRIAGVPRAAGGDQDRGNNMSDASTQAVRDAERAQVTITVAAEPPREPTREDLRRVRDALDEHYLEAKGCYAKSFSDETVAAKLGVPRAWVAQVREPLYGPDTNEAAAERSAQLADFEARLKALEEASLKLAADAEALRREIARAAR